ncbi:MAG TPA: hypothetical protein VMS18_00745 [Candidatus Binatia bacterium]|nr:hypothetical protein [Candidatus Binatia bacterium]
MDRPFDEEPESSRRSFLKGFTALPLLSMLTRGNLPDTPAAPPLAQNATATLKDGHCFVAIQVGARSFVDEGVDGVLDTFQQKAGVNVIMPAVFTYGRGLAGRQIPGQPLPDHGVQAYDEIHGGSYSKLYPEFSSKSVIQNVRAPELGEFDILSDVIPKAKARGIQTYVLFEEAYNSQLMPGFEKIAEVDLDGRAGGSTCFNNPNARAFLVALVENWFSHNELDGMMWESEREGPLNTALGAHFGKFDGDSRIYCFCEHCVSKAKDQGIQLDRVRAGYAALDQWVKQTTKPNRGDGSGSFVSLWRLFLDYPEILQWHSFWMHSQEEVYGLLYRAVKNVNPKAHVGWHIMHLVTMSPLYQADQNFSRIAKVADFLKPCPYNNCAGPRFARYIRNVNSTVFRDLTSDEVLELHYRLLGYEHEPSLEKLPTSGMSAGYVARETRRALAEVNGAIPIYPGIDIDIPTALNEKRTEPGDVKAAVLAAFRAGAPGVVLSRKYAEMKLTNLAGAGDALRELT